MKIKQITIRILSLFILSALLIPFFAVAAFAEETYDDPSLPDVFDQTIPSNEESEDEQPGDTAENEPLPAFTVAVISIAAIGLLVGFAYYVHHLSTRRSPKKKK